MAEISILITVQPLELGNRQTTLPASTSARIFATVSGAPENHRGGEQASPTPPDQPNSPSNQALSPHLQQLPMLAGKRVSLAHRILNAASRLKNIKIIQRWSFRNERPTTAAITTTGAQIVTPS